MTDDPTDPHGPPDDLGEYTPGGPMPGGMNMEGVVVYPLPATYSVARTRVAGEDVVFLWVATPSGGIGTFWPLPDARTFANAILDAAGGIQVASSMPPGDVPPGLIHPGGTL